MEIQKKSIIIRPELAAPEVDEYDEVPLSSIASPEKREIGQYVQYKL